MALDDVGPQCLQDFMTQRMWDRVVGNGAIPVEYDINHPENADRVAQLRAEALQSLPQPRVA